MVVFSLSAYFFVKVEILMYIFKIPYKSSHITGAFMRLLVTLEMRP